ncbi:glycosyltransferase [Phyllobacterium sp. SYP-B3895]|nr:glycosyltransferase [Phyllobacterium sp. SYP-B3895]
MHRGKTKVRVLITNFLFGTRSGSESVVELLADALRIAGHDVMIFAPTLRGEAQVMIHNGHRIYSEIDQIPYLPDVIHAHHISPCFIAMARFPDVPVVYTCHSSVFALEAPLLHPQIRHYVAVDEACRDKCLACGIPADMLSVIGNAVDASRFAARSRLPDSPAKALLLTKQSFHAEIVRTACRESEIELDELGPGTGAFSDQLELELPRYDIVFATARMALEAAFVGCSVVVCDARGFAGLLTSRTVRTWRKHNFGVRLLARPTTVALLMEAIDQYDANDAALVTDYLRREAPADYYVAAYEKIYRKAIKAAPADANGLGLANGRWAQELAVTAEKRLWYRIASEMQWMPEHKSISDMLHDTKVELLAHMVSLSERQNASASLMDTRTALIGEQIDQMQRDVSASADFLENLRSMYRAVVPFWLRRAGANLRARFARR